MDDGIKRYTCTQCGIEVRAEDNQDHRACACNADWTVTPEDQSEPPADPPADPPPE